MKLKCLVSNLFTAPIQGYVVCPSEKRFLLLFTFLKKNRKKKVMVFFSSCMSVKYHYELLNYIDMPVLAIHGRQKQNKRKTTFFQFCNADSGILLCTDVAARGLDIPEVDWIVQYDPPDDPKVTCVFRMGLCVRVHLLLRETCHFTSMTLTCTEQLLGPL